MSKADTDLLEGADKIARFLEDEIGLEDVPVRRAFHLCAAKIIPAGKLGGNWIGSKKAIRAHFAKITGGQGAA
jgi:hypothetical protein